MDPYRKGVRIYVGWEAEDFCPVAAVLDYMVRRGLRPGPFFMSEDGWGLTRERLVKTMRQALTLLGYDCSRYTGHSFRIGAATVAAQQGIQDSLIRTMGRWERKAYLHYIRTPKEVLCGVAATMTVQGRNGCQDHNKGQDWASGEIAVCQRIKFNVLKKYEKLPEWGLNSGPQALSQGHTHTHTHTYIFGEQVRHYTVVGVKLKIGDISLYVWTYVCHFVLWSSCICVFLVVDPVPILHGILWFYPYHQLFVSLIFADAVTSLQVQP